MAVSLALLFQARGTAETGKRSKERAEPAPLANCVAVTWEQKASGKKMTICPALSVKAGRPRRTTGPVATVGQGLLCVKCMGGGELVKQDRLELGGGDKQRAGPRAPWETRACHSHLCGPPCPASCPSERLGRRSWGASVPHSDNTETGTPEGNSGV